MVDRNDDRRWWREIPSEDEFLDITGVDREEFRSVIGDTLPERILAYAHNWIQRAMPLYSKPDDDDELVEDWFSAYTRFRAKIFGSKGQAKKTETSEAWRPRELETRSNAFSLPEKKSTTGQYPSTAVLDKLLQQYRAYAATPSRWMGPYTTIIGPSGIGKSFAVKQLSVRHGMYVAYTNLAPLMRPCYPRPVAMGRVPPVNLGREQLTKLWQDFLELQLRLVEACKKEGITPAGFIALLTSSKPPLASQRQKLEKALQTQVTDAALEAMIVDCKSVLVQHSANLKPCHPDATPQPISVLCFDEARELLDNRENLSFRCLRHAAAEVFHETVEMPFFVVLLDTTSRISNLTPSLEADPSRKQASKNVFPPIHKIDTWDVLAPEHSLDVDGSVDSVKQLFSHGRPLWASFLASGDSVGEVAGLASDKMAGARNALHLALLTYRVNFYVTSRELAETLVASLMRYLISISDNISDNCSRLLTSQPSEPVLAFAASRELQKPEIRLQCINAWAAALQTGACNLGDVGEMVAALVLLFSFDYVARPLSELPHAVRVQDFCDALLRPPNWATLRSSHGHGHGHGPEVQEVLEDGWVFFNHFVRASSTPTADSLELAHKRGAALFLPAQFPGMDVAIPIRIRTTGALAVLLVQVKNRHGDSPTPGLRLKMAEDLDKAARKLGTSRLHSVIGLAMCLRRNEKSENSENSTPAVDLMEPARRRSLRPRRAAASSSLAQPALPPDAAEKKAHLLAIVFGLRGVYPCLEHPTRQSGEEEEEKSAAAKEKERDAMDRVCSLFEELLGKWPDFYKDEDVESAYAQKLLDPFYARHATEGECQERF